MSNCLVAYATRHGATAEIAEALAEALRAAGHSAELRPADEVERFVQQPQIAAVS